MLPYSLCRDQVQGSELGAERGTLGSLSLCEQEETGPAALRLWWEINQTNRPTIWISTLGEGARQQAPGQEGNAKAFYHLNNFPWACSHPNARSGLRLFFFFLTFYFILTNAQTFLPQIILGQVTS